MTSASERREREARARGASERVRDIKKGMTKFALRVGFSFPSHDQREPAEAKTPLGSEKSDFGGSMTIYRDIIL